VVGTGWAVVGMGWVVAGMGWVVGVMEKAAAGAAETAGG